MRTEGVAGTRVGYTQGTTEHPSYEQVCAGTTRHCEAILVVYDPRVVTYERLVEIAVERLDSTAEGQLLGNLFDDDQGSDHSQYRHGVFYHNQEQMRIAQEALRKSEGRHDIELKQATKFYWAEEYHQKYLLKGGQSARKNAKEPIRCYG
uniref:peptide-methionine (S)-S-oxide reductase n=1 Tax=Trieres chinensis TaxID=1514140 RepID=A0A7S2EGD5_TRICV|mmetsp:Transcript_21693/g.43862  ORF Transcript_21693/g.43862 Transcript_21693/m.43862 type:complete len:150 (+) Transcript_21693:1-450(+)